MWPSRAFAIALRIVQQFRRDRRTLALMVVVPIVVMGLLGVSMPEGPLPGMRILDTAAPAILGAFFMFFVFLLTGVSFLRERAQGTFERLLATPASRNDIVLGYMAGFFLFAVVQTIIIVLFTIYVLDVNYRGPLWLVLVFQFMITGGSVNLGIFISTFARNEFQVVQFIPIIMVPQFLLCGVLWPVSQMPRYLQWTADFLPLTYAVQGLQDVMLRGMGIGDVWLELAVLAAFAAAMFLLAALTVRRGVA